MVELAAIADDFTGATDLATSLRSHGFRAVVSIEDAPLDGLHDEDVDAVVVALKTRTAPAADAVSRSLTALHGLLRLHPERFYVKYCSTFDSTDDGNIGPVLDAVSDALGERRTVVVPAFPDNGRTVYLGHLFVGDQLLAESPMRHHPLTPMTRSRIAELLAAQTSRTIHEVPLPVVRQGAHALSAHLDELGDGYVVIDTVADEDLATITAATRDWRLVSGGAGLAYGMTGPRDLDRERFDAPHGRRLVVCGSASETTRRQIAAATAAGLPVHRIDADEVAADAGRVVDGVLSWLRGLPADATPVVYSVGSLDDVDPAAGVAERIEAAIAEVVHRAVDELGARRIIVAGGETSGAVVQRLGVLQLRIGPQIAPGVCWSAATTRDGTEVAVALKSGNFGGPEMFADAWGELADGTV